MQHQDADFVFEGVAERGGLCAGAGCGDGYFTKLPDGRRKRLPHRKREDVGGVVFAEEAAVEAAEFAIAGDEAGEAGAPGDFATQSPGEVFQVAAVQFRRGAAEQNYIVV